ncbi:MAG: hypothetical protein Q8O89_00695, partial [Nanoarchaeota archaeon]|nr:hypothetical protein [Nanoarchaeota archaeon]
GINPGCKSITNYGIPQFIMQSDKKIQAIFIKQFFNDEGNVRLKDRRLQIKQTAVISVSKNEAKQNPLKYAHKSLINIQKLLANQGIDSKISLSSYRKDRADWELSIYRIENLKIFQKKINFDLEYKKKLLEKSIKSYKFPSAARNGRLDFAFNCAKETQKRYGFITKHLLAKNCNRSLKTATYYLIDLKKTSQVICTEKPKNKYGQKKPHKYIVNI